MAETKIKAGQFSGIVGHGTDGYFLMTNGDGTMAWAEGGATGPSVTSVSYPGDDLAADPAGGQTVVLTGTNFGSSMTVSIGGTTAPSVAHDSSTQLTITTPVKAAGDYDIVVTNTVTGASGTFVNGISYNGVPTWTTAAGSLGTFESETTISTITLQATEPDGGTITFNITNGALPTGLSLTGANIDGTTTAESSTTLYSFTIEAIDDENQSTPRNFSITVNSAALISSENFTINTYTGNGSTQSIEGKIGTAASFDGSSSYIDLGNSAPFGDRNDIKAISGWIKSNSGNRVWLYSVSGTTDAINWFYVAYRPDNNAIYVYRRLDTSNKALTSATITDDGDWHHIVAQLTATEVEIYLDGTKLTTTNANEGSGSNTSWISYGAYGGTIKSTIGKSRQDTPSYTDGYIDQIRFFNKALSSSEITTLYGENNASSTKSTTDIFDDGSGVALYEFEEGAKDTGGVSGYIGAGGIFNGSSSRIALPKLTGLTADVSVSGWVNLGNTTTSNRIRFISLNLDTNGFAGTLLVMYRPSDGEWQVRAGNGTSSNATVLTHTYPLTQSTWYHICFTRNDASNETIFYVNGSEQDTESVSVSSSYPANATGTIGDLHYSSGLDYNWLGKIDQVRIFDKAISSSEVTTLYGETSASATKSTKDIFDDGSGVALYELEGNANDTPKGAIDSGQSAVFNGSSSKILLTNSPFSNTEDASVSFWVKDVVAPSSSYNTIYQGDGNDYFYITVDTAGEIRVYPDNYQDPTYSRYSTQLATTSSNVTDGNWHHIVVVNKIESSANGGGYKIYVDGSENASASFSSTLRRDAGDNTNGSSIGSNNIGTSNYYEGKIDQVRVYSSALSSGDVTNLYNETNVPTANLVAHYKLDGNANDETTNYNGTATSITYSDPAEFPTYDGTATNVSYAYNGTPTNVSFVGTSFQPDLVWIKDRTTAEQHGLFDSVRGADKWLHSETTQAEQTYGGGYGVTSFDSNGFTIGNGTAINRSNDAYVAWCWKAGGSVTPNNNTDGSITSSVSANPDAGFSIVSYTGTNNVSETFGHGLSSAPELIIIKNRDVVANMFVYPKSLGNFLLRLNTTGGQDTTSNYQLGTVNDSIITLPSLSSDGWSQPYDFITYCFHSVDGYQKVGSYTGNGGTLSVTTGFAPRFVMLKPSSLADNWMIYDTLRGKDIALFPNLSNADATYAGRFSFLSNGFQLSTSNSGWNGNGSTYIYLAIA